MRVYGAGRDRQGGHGCARAQREARLVGGRAQRSGGERAARLERQALPSGRPVSPTPFCFLFIFIIHQSLLMLIEK